MSDRSAENHVAHLTWDQVARRLEGGAAAILPVGAAAKEHGLHLPMNTDQLQAEWLADKLAQRIDALVWPTITYGYYPAFVEYAGSACLSAAAFELVVKDIVRELVRFGARAVIILDTGISTIPIIHRAVIGLEARTRVRHLRIHDGPRYQNAHRTILAKSWGGHADEAETSRMLAFAPERVNMSRAQASMPGQQQVPGPLSHADPNAPNYSASGSIGDPLPATPAKGEILLAAMLGDIVEAARAAIAEE